MRLNEFCEQVRSNKTKTVPLHKLIRVNDTLYYNDWWCIVTEEILTKIKEETYTEHGELLAVTRILQENHLPYIIWDNKKGIQNPKLLVEHGDTLQTYFGSYCVHSSIYDDSLVGLQALDASYGHTSFSKITHKINLQDYSLWLTHHNNRILNVDAILTYDKNVKNSIFKWRREV